jgi:hypothetical protein
LPQRHESSKEKSEVLKLRIFYAISRFVCCVEYVKENMAERHLTFSCVAVTKYLFIVCVIAKLTLWLAEAI